MSTRVATSTTSSRHRRGLNNPLLLSVVLLFRWVTVVCADRTQQQQPQQQQPIPTFSISDLKTRARRSELQEILSTTGLLAVRFDDHDENNNNNSNKELYSRHRKDALQGLCDCHDDPSFLKDISDTRSIVLHDEATVRTSVATATVGMDHPLPLPDGLIDVCGLSTAVAMEGLRDAVSDVSKAFVAALEDVVLGEAASTVSTSSPLLRDSHGYKTYSSITSIVQSANHLEHFHVYSRETTQQQQQQLATTEETQQTAAWEWHTDAGLFLVFVPAWDCHDHSYHKDHSFWYQNAEGKPVQAQFDDANTAIVMLGQGAQDWLNLPQQQQQRHQRQKLKATVHSVRWDKHQQQRSWYGMMYLVPETAMIYGTKTLRDVRKSLSLHEQRQQQQQQQQQERNKKTGGVFRGYDDEQHDEGMIALGCGISQPTVTLAPQTEEEQEEWTLLSQTGRRRRLQHQDASACNNVTNFFCWMQCLDVPNAEQAQGYVNEGYSLYCVDPAVLASSGNRVSEAAAPCENGWVHNPSCVGSWQPTAPGVPASSIAVKPTSVEAAEQPFCYGGTTMYMDGFHFVQSTTCVVYLFQSWVLNTAGKYAFAFFGTILVGIALEKGMQLRRKFMVDMEAGRKRLLVSATFHCIQLTIAYFLMLVIMIYSGVLFIATVLGLVCGHVMFNAKDAFFPLESTKESKEDSTQDVSSNQERKSENQQENALEATITKGEGNCNCQVSMVFHEELVNEGDKNYGSTAQSKRDSENQGIPEGATPCCQTSYD
mmetsp:Transcript_28159/g.46654  ORF Transcript_28159/g.46654 Transcript_28159/m.46654 type:complete len:767 (-) Transcript_28159:44-2344(-)